MKNEIPRMFLYSAVVEKPLPKDDEVLVKIDAVSINAADYRCMRMGIIPKGRIFGADIAGRVEAAGKDIKKFKVGDEVFGDIASCGFGGFAEFVAVTENALALKPARVTFEEAVAVPMAAVTALQALRDQGNIQPGQKVLIYGASGGVGTFAIQLAKNFGAEVTAVCSPRNTELQGRSGRTTSSIIQKRTYLKAVGIMIYHGCKWKTSVIRLQTCTSPKGNLRHCRWRAHPGYPNTPIRSAPVDRRQKDPGPFQQNRARKIGISHKASGRRKGQACH